MYDVSLASHRSLIEEVKFNSRFFFFSQLHYSHVKREGNKVAHCLARHVITVLDLAMDRGCSTIICFCTSG